MYYPIFHEDPQIFQHLPLTCHCIPSIFYQYSSNCISFTCPHPVQYPLKIPLISHSISPFYSIPFQWYSIIYPNFLLAFTQIFHWYWSSHNITFSTTIFLGFSLFFSMFFIHCWLHMSSTCARWPTPAPAMRREIAGPGAKARPRASSGGCFFTVVITGGFLGIASGVGRWWEWANQRLGLV